ncbi:hypothetical protein [Clostridium sp. C2-6-12]|uniref:hypothetical protein n=1 Tax=Clostridium sp. C2-6-12 TaxID=2698832 RepID=UPI00136B303A|nr:hypothetical protein [Clostridium sp. C2-6-12]
MNNPFLQEGFLTPNASINKLTIDIMPTDKVKQDLRGKAALDIFSTGLFIEEIKKNSQALNIELESIEEKMLPQYLNECLQDNNFQVKSKAEEIVKLFGERLAVILLTLKKGEKINRLKRKDWEDNHWDYWRNIRNIILVGGLSSSKIGENLKFYVEKVFKDSNEEGYKIILAEDSSNCGIKGCASYIQGEKEQQLYLIFDCGHTFIKRSLVRIQEKEVKEIIKLDKVLAKYIECEFENFEKEKIKAEELHEYLADLIINTIKYASDQPLNIGNHIVISVANYVKKGLFTDRGGYGKLRLIANNYEEYLSNVLYEKLGIRFKISLIHDGTAMAAAFSKYEKAVCISLGTSFGVGFL